MRRVLKVGLVFLASWATGLVAYLAALALLHVESMSSGDLRAVVFWSLLAFGISFIAVHLPVLLGIRSLLKGVQPLWPFPVVAGLLGFIPSVLIDLFWGGDIAALVSSELTLFHVLFVVAGLVAGFGLARFCWQSPTVQSPVAG